jgi:hypothetical protein
MTVLARIIKIKILDLLNRPVILILLLVLPVLLGSIAGTANVRNTGKEIALAIVDEDNTPSSLKVIADLKAKGWQAELSEPQSAERRLIKEQIDGILTIEKGFEQSLVDFNDSRLKYAEAEGSMVTVMVREVIVASVLPLYSRESMLNQLEALYLENGKAIPEDLDERFSRNIAELRQGSAKITIEYFGDLILAPTLTFVVSDYSMEVFFLSIYAILGTLSLSRATLRQRLGSTARGLALDYTATLAGLQLLGQVQILLYTVSMRLLMNQPFIWRDLQILSVFLFLMLGLGQLLSLIEESLRLYLSLLLLLFLAVMGGCFFQLSHRLLLDYGQYSPHGWALSAMRGTSVSPVWLVCLTAVIMIAAGYYLQKKRVSRIID